MTNDIRKDAAPALAVDEGSSLEMTEAQWDAWDRETAAMWRSFYRSKHDKKEHDKTIATEEYMNEGPR